MCRNLFALLLLCVYITKNSIAEIFLVRPGDGEQFVYSPVDANATLPCAVNNMLLTWDVAGFSFDNTFERYILNSRGVFQTIHTTEALSNSTLTVYGDIDVNNNIRICCGSNEGLMHRESCTTLIIYDSPLPPENVSVQFTEVFGQVNISWTATPVTGVDQNYTVFFDSQAIDITEPYYIYIQNSSDSKIRCSAYVTAVNGAGESDPSNNVTIPSLPDIGPVTASLSHQVWKSAGGEIMVNVSFKPALYCINYPVSTYLLKLTSEEIGRGVEKSLGSNETEVTIGPSDDFKANKRCQYTVTVVNSIGNTTSDTHVIITSDVQSVTATVVGESTIDILCLFIHGSDAVGCKVVLVSDHPGVNNETETLLKRNTSAFGQLNLTLKAACYHRVVAYTFDVNYTTNNFYIEEVLFNNHSVTNIECSGSDEAQSLHIAMIIIVVIVLFTLCLLVIVISVISFIVILRKKLETGAKTTQDDEKYISYVSAISTNYQPDNTKHPEKLTLNEAPPLQDAHLDETLEKNSASSLTHSPTKSPLDSVPNTKEQNTVQVVSTNSTIPASLIIPLYAVPEKVKTKREIESNLKVENVEFDSVNDEENFYHVLENDVASTKDDVITSVPFVPKLPPPPVKGSSLQAIPEPTAQNTTETRIVGRNLAATNDSVGCIIASQAQPGPVPVYAVPDKVRSKNKSVLSQNTCDTAIKNESGGQSNAEQEHVYHILENNKAPCKGRATPPDSNATDLPPPFKPGTPPSDQAPVYQDIAEINTK